MIMLKALTNKVSLISGLLVTTIILLWPAVPLQSLTVWFQILVSKSPNNILYPLFAILVGCYIALYVYDRKVAKCCNTKNTKITSFSSFMGIFVGACPACIPFLAFFLPLPMLLVLQSYSWIILSIAILIIFFSIWRMGGLTKQKT